MDSLKERHKSYQQKRRFDGIMKLERSESRHNKNMLNVQKKLDERDEKNEYKLLICEKFSNGRFGYFCSKENSTWISG